MAFANSALGGRSSNCASKAPFLTRLRVSRLSCPGGRVRAEALDAGDDLGPDVYDLHRLDGAGSGYTDEQVAAHDGQCAELRRTHQTVAPIVPYRQAG